MAWYEGGLALTYLFKESPALFNIINWLFGPPQRQMCDFRDRWANLALKLVAAVFPTRETYSILPLVCENRAVFKSSSLFFLWHGIENYSTVLTKFALLIRFFLR